MRQVNRTIQCKPTQNTMNNAFAKTLIAPGKEFRHAWKSKLSKNPNHLRFNDGARIQYMRDGILTLTDGTSGTYDRIDEWSGEERDSQSGSKW